MYNTFLFSFHSVFQSDKKSKKDKKNKKHSESEQHVAQAQLETTVESAPPAPEFQAPEHVEERVVEAPAADHVRTCIFR